MKHQRLFNPVLILSLLMASMASLIHPATAAAQGTTVPCYVLNGRDFSGLVVTGSPTDSRDGFTWASSTGETETYADAMVAAASVRTDIYPEISVEAGVPSNTYRAWFFLGAADGDRSLDVTFGSDGPVHVVNPQSGGWLWRDMGIHTLAGNTLIKVKAVGALEEHGQGVPERRGGIRSIYLTADTAAGAPTFLPDGQTTCASGLSMFEFSDDFESYPIASKPTDLYEYKGILGWNSGDPAPAADRFQIGSVGANQTYQYAWAGPSYHHPHVRQLYIPKFSRVYEVGATYLYTQPSMGIEMLMFEWDVNAPANSIFLMASYSNTLQVYRNGTSQPLLGELPLWPDTIITQMSHRIEAKRLSNTLIEASITRLDTNETLTKLVPIPYQESGTGFSTGFGFYEDWGGGVYVNIDDFYVEGIPLNTPTSLSVTSTSADIYEDEPFAVDLNIENANDLYAAQALCQADAAVIQPQEAVFGDFFDPTDRLIGINNADAASGTWTGAISQRNPALPLSGDGLFATVTYRAQAAGTTSLSCEPLFADQNGLRQPDEFTGLDVTILPYARVSGTGQSQGRVDHSNITVTATGPFERIALADASGAFLLMLKTGGYSVTVSAPGYLSVSTPITVTSGDTVTLPSVTLKGGDANGDNTIDIGDAALVAANFGLPVPPADERADINGDKLVNVQDLAILGGNYGLSGE